jgi:hypothetical protein
MALLTTNSTVLMFLVLMSLKQCVLLVCSAADAKAQFESGLKAVGSFLTVESFWKYQVGCVLCRLLCVVLCFASLLTHRRFLSSANQTKPNQTKLNGTAQNNIIAPTSLPLFSNYHLFKKGIVPSTFLWLSFPVCAARVASRLDMCFV